MTQGKKMILKIKMNEQRKNNLIKFSIYPTFLIKSTVYFKKEQRIVNLV